LTEHSGQPVAGISSDPGKKKKTKIREWTEAILFAFFAVMLFRLFLFEAFTIPSSSMEKSLLKGDYILVSKLHYGARMPLTPLSLPFFHQHLTERLKSYLDWISFPYYRFPGVSQMKINDIVVFNTPESDEFPVDHRTYYIKRCMGTPGDTFEIRGSKVYANGKMIEAPLNQESDYIVKTDSTALDSARLQALNVTDMNVAPVHGHYLVELTSASADSIRTWKNVVSVTLNSPKKGQKDEGLFPYGKNFNWNLDNYGPMLIPRKGATVKLSIDTLPLYRKIIVEYEHNQLETRHDSIFINGKYTTDYVFKMNYYFMMGDNRHFSLDSRFWGFVPEDHVVGKAVLILTSIDRSTKHWRWDRVFKKIN
jgi:signal peptidase I